jgi:hypothetical protein
MARVRPWHPERSPLDEFKAMPTAMHEAARFWIREGYYSPGLSSALIEQLDAWVMRFSMAHPATQAAVRAEASLPPLRTKRRAGKAVSLESPAEPG